MLKILGLALLMASSCAQAATFKPEMPLDLTFSTFLELPVSSDSELKSYFPKAGVYRMFDVFCAKSLQHCNVWVHDVADEYCAGKDSAPSPSTSGFNFNYWEDVKITRAGSDLNFEVEDGRLYGETRNSLKISLSQNPDTHRMVVTKVSGIASALSTTQGVPLQAQYRPLKSKVTCDLSFFPPEQQ